MELDGVEEDEEGEGAWAGEGDYVAEEGVGEADDAVGGGGLEVLELGEEVGGG